MSFWDFFLGKPRYCWEVLRDGKRIGYLCKDYEEFRTLIEGLEHPQGSQLRVRQIKARYRPPSDPFVRPKSSYAEKQRPRRASENKQTTSTSLWDIFQGSGKPRKPWKAKRSRHRRLPTRRGIGR